MQNTEKKILLVEDNPADVRLLMEAIIDCDNELVLNVDVADDGIDALNYLKVNHPVPDMIILDLNLPRMDGREVLSIIKNDINYKAIPVVVLTSSQSDDDVAIAYGRHANCYIKKPVIFDHYLDVVSKIRDFWIDTVILPPKDAPIYIRRASNS